MTDLKWSYNEFLAFLLIYVAHVDMEFSEEEKTLIIDKTSESVLTKMLKEFESMSDYKSFETILSYKDLYFPTEEEKEELINEMEKLFFVDHDFNAMEKGLLQFFNKMM